MASLKEDYVEWGEPRVEAELENIHTLKRVRQKGEDTWERAPGSRRAC